MVSTAGAWIIVIILIVVFVTIGLVYWYFEFYQVNQKQLKNAAKSRGEPQNYPVDTPPFDGN